jgi:hypothetical protein
MTRVLILSIIFAVLFFISNNPVFAQFYPKGKVMFEISGDYGFTLPSQDGSYNTSDGDEVPSGWFGSDVGAAIKIGYGISDRVIMCSGCEIHKREFDVLTFYNGAIYYQKYIEIPAVVRLYLSKKVYVDTGAYYGIKVGKIKQSGSLSGDNPKTKNDYGFLMGFGLLWPINERNGIDTGTKIRLGVPRIIYDNGGKVRNSLDFTFTAGYVFFYY